MISSKITKKLILNHAKRYPKLKAQDIFKFIFQSAFGCEHLVSDKERVISYIEQELKNFPSAPSKIEELDGDYSRVHLGIIREGLSVTTLGNLFYLSAKKEANGMKQLTLSLKAVAELIDEGKLPVNKDEYYALLREWEEAGFPAIRHSDEFRENYKPCYRVIANRFIPLLPLLCKIDEFISSNSNGFATEFKEASGNLLTVLQEIYKERLSEIKVTNKLISLAKQQ